MTQTKSSFPTRAVNQLVPINQLITLPEGIPIPFDHLEIADLSTLPRNVTLVTFIGPSIKVLITKSTVLRVKVVYKIRADDPLAQKYGAKAVLRAMSHTTEIGFAYQSIAKQLLSLTGASWKLPDEATRHFEMPITSTGSQVLAAVQGSDEFIVKMTEELLAQKVKTHEPTAQS